MRSVKKTTPRVLMPRGRRSTRLGVAIGLAGVLLMLLPPVLRLEQSVGLSGLFALRGTAGPPDGIAVVSIAGDSADALGLGSSDLDEWPRSLHAELIERLAAAGASVIVLDIIFEDARDPAEDRQLARALERAGRVVLLDRVRTREVELGSGGTTAPLDRRHRPIEPLRRAAAATAPFVLPTVPIRTSQFWTFGRSAAGEANLPAVALQLHLADAYDELVAAVCERAEDCGDVPGSFAALLASRDVGAAMARIRELFASDAGLADRVRAANESRGVERLVDLYAGPAGRHLSYYGEAGTIPTIPMHEILADADRAAALAGKTVFVGFAERRQAEQQDAFYTVFSEPTGQNLSGVEIGATAFANLLANETLRLPARAAELVLVLGFGLALGAAAWTGSVRRAVAAGALAAAAYAAGAWAAFAAANLWLPLVVPLAAQWPAWLVALLAVEYRDVAAQRARIEAALGYYVPPRAVRRLTRESVDRGRAGELLDGVCLYTDAEQFTRVAETLTPDGLARLLNDYYEVLCATAERHDGLVTDISGDSMVAIWAAVRRDAGLSRAACAAALAIGREVERFNTARGAGRLPTRIGLDAGSLLLGDIGSERRREYRAVGELVATASRLQGLNRVLGTRVLVSAAVACGAEGFMTRRVGRFLLRGKSVPVDVHALLDPEAGDAHDASMLFGPFDEALACFARAEFAAARARFERIAAELPDDGPTRFYLERCARLEGWTPGADWDGSVRMDAK